VVDADGGCGCGAGCGAGSGSGAGCGCGGACASSPVAGAAPTKRTPRPGRVRTAATRPGPPRAAQSDGVCQSVDERVHLEEPPARRDGLPQRATHLGDGRAGLLLCPGALGTVDLGLPLAETLCRVPPGPDGLLRAPRARRAADLALGMGSGRERARWYTADDDGVAQLGYRTERFFVPWRWLSEYTHDLAATRAKEGGGTAPVGLVSAVEEALATLLPEFMAVRRSTGVEKETFMKLVGCWNIPTTGNDSRYFFWHDGWGAPHRFYLNTCWLILGYSGYLTDPTHFQRVLPPFAEYCRGFSEFVRTLLRGGEPESMVGSRACSLRLLVRGGEGTGEVESLCEPRRDPKSCDVGYATGCGGLAWDDWSKRFDAGDWTWRFDAVGRDHDGAPLVEDHMPQSACSTYMQWGDGGYVKAQAGHLTALATVADWALYQARMALDFYRAGEGSVRYLAVGRRLARYAVRLMAQWGRSLVHEFGHHYIGVSGHCEFGTCFDMAARNWMWHVVGELGLPIGSYKRDSSLSTDFPEAIVRKSELEQVVGTCGDSAHYIDYSLYFESVGTVGDRVESCVDSSYMLDKNMAVIRVFDIEHCPTLSIDGEPGPSMTLVEDEDPPSVPEVLNGVMACVEVREGRLVGVPCPEDELPWEFDEPYDPS
jgi:hypothetical protein